MTIKYARERYSFSDPPKIEKIELVKETEHFYFIVAKDHKGKPYVNRDGTPRVDRAAKHGHPPLFDTWAECRDNIVRALRATAEKQRETARAHDDDANKLANMKDPTK